LSEAARRSEFKSGFTIYARALVIFSIGLLLLFGALFFLTEGVILGQFAEVEQQYAREEVRRVLYQFEQESSALAALASDLADWDELDEFTRGTNPDFPRNNLDPASMANLQLDFVAILNEENQLVLLAGSSLQPPDEIWAEDLSREIQSEKLARAAADAPAATGIIMLDRQITSIAVVGITRSDGGSPRGGTLVLGRVWSPARLASLLPPGVGTLSVLHLGRALSDPMWRESTIKLLATGNPVIVTPNENFTLGLMLLRNPEGAPLAVLVLQQDRELFQIAKRSARIFLLAMTAAGGSVVILLWLVIDRSILRRLGEIDRAVRMYRGTGKFPADLDTKSRDELGHLARSIQDLTFSLQESESALRDMSGRLLQLQDDERRRIARELHDSTAQNLSALEMNLALLEGARDPMAASFRDLVRSSREIADACSREIRTISYLLHPPLLDEVGLVFAIRWFVEGYEARTGIRVELDLPEQFPRLLADLETALFRIVQECLTNVYRHSGSRSAQIRLKTDGVLIDLKVSDQGHGIPYTSDPGQHRPGLGLMGMRERVRQQGGKFSLESGEFGTRIEVSLPYSAAQIGESTSDHPEGLADGLDTTASASSASA
jgi:signal transduction histidine kinase